MRVICLPDIRSTTMIGSSTGFNVVRADTRAKHHADVHSMVAGVLMIVSLLDSTLARDFVQALQIGFGEITMSAFMLATMISACTFSATTSPNRVSITRIARSRLHAVRHPAYRVPPPEHPPAS
jgi:hypothetical protein